MSTFATIIADLAAQGWAVSNDFLPPDAVSALADEARGLWAADRFRQAAVGGGSGHAVRLDIRGDRITWLDEHSLTPIQARYWAEIEALRGVLNRELFLGLESFEAHLAVYPPGAFYQRHLDRPATSDTRVISCSLYLNTGWRVEHGGQFRLYLAEGHVDIPPCVGAFVVFRSDTVFHEVLPATQHRFSLTGWYKKRSLQDFFGIDRRNSEK